MRLRKIPLEPLIQILQDLYDSGADYIDVSGEQNGQEGALKDVIKITVKPNYMSKIVEDETEDDDDDDYNDALETDYSDDDDLPDVIIRKLSDEDINNLI